MTDAQLALILRSAADILVSPGATSVRFVLTTFRYKETGLMANPRIPFNASRLEIATVHLVWTGPDGADLPVIGGTATCDHPEFATVTVVAGDTGVDVTPVAAGTIVVTYTPSKATIPAAMCTLDVVVAESTATAVSFGDVTFRLASAPAVITTS